MSNTTPLQQVMLAGGRPAQDRRDHLFLTRETIADAQAEAGPRTSRTAGEVELSSQFTEAHKIWRMFRRAIGDLAMWRVAAREIGFSKSDACFYPVNGGPPATGQGFMGIFRFPLEKLPER